jgi:hypothetical protein
LKSLAEREREKQEGRRRRRRNMFLQSSWTVEGYNAREREREEVSRLEKALAKPLSISFPLYRICRHYYHYDGFSVCLALCVVVVAGLHMNVSCHSREKTNLSYFL